MHVACAPGATGSESDNTGDGIMITGDVAALAADYCRRGVATTFRTYPGRSHTEAIVPWSADAVTFLAARFAGQTVNGCG